jgi:hypothetical protein
MRTCGAWGSIQALVLQDLERQHADAPSLFGFRDLSAHGVGEHLVPEADPRVGPVEGTDEGGQVGDPG